MPTQVRVLLECPEMIKVRFLVEQTRFKPYSEYREIDHSRLADHVMGLIEGFRGRTASFFGLSVGDELTALAVLSELPFDTSHFGFRCGRVDLLGLTEPNPVHLEQLFAEIGRVAIEKGFRNLMIRVDALATSASLALERNRFEVVDVSVKYAFDFRRTAIADMASCKVRSYVPEDIPALSNIATTFVENRFHLDPRFPHDKADLLYFRWIENSAKGMSDDILVAEVEGSPVGFTTIKEMPQLSPQLGLRIGTMVFSAVDPLARGRNVYTSMIHAGLHWFAGKADVVEVNTLVHNVAVQRAWTTLGFKIVHSSITFHWWAPES